MSFSSRSRTSCGRQQILRLLDRDLQIRRDQVGQPCRLAHLHRHHLKLIGQIGHQRDEFGKLTDEVACSASSSLSFDGLGQALHVRPEIRLALHEIEQFDSRDALHQHPHTLVRIRAS